MGMKVMLSQIDSYANVPSTGKDEGSLYLRLHWTVLPA